MTQKQAKKILGELDCLKVAVVSTLEGFEAEDTKDYEKMFDTIYREIEEAVGL